MHAPIPAAFLESNAFCSNCTLLPIPGGCLSIIAVPEPRPDYGDPNSHAMLFLSLDTEVSSFIQG